MFVSGILVATPTRGGHFAEPGALGGARTMRGAAVPLVIIGRINRRPDTLGADLASFHDEMEALVTRESWEAPAVARNWLASDLKWDPSKTFVTGLVGYQDSEVYFTPDQKDRSWSKAKQDTTKGGTSKTVVPFAIDAREDHQWIAFAQAAKVRSKTFRQAMTALLTQAAINANLMPAVWDVDPVVEPETVLDWIRENPDVATLTRIVKFPNARPEKYDIDREVMRELNTPKLTEIYKPPEGERVHTDSAAFSEMLNELERGYIEMKLVSGRGTEVVRFNSASRKHDEVIEAYGRDFDRGISLVLSKLVSWVSKRQGPQPTLMDE
jgi:hypothetical protein